MKRRNRKNKILSLFLALALLLLLLPDGTPLRGSQASGLGPDITPIPTGDPEDAPDAGEIAVQETDAADGVPEQEAEEIPLELGDGEDEDAALRPSETEEAPERFEKGYVRVTRDELFYADASLSEVAGAFDADGYLWAQIERRGDFPEEDVLRVAFDTAQRREAGADSVTGFIRFDVVEPLDDAAQASLRESLEDSREWNGALLPEIDCTLLADVAEEPTAEPTALPTEEPTEVSNEDEEQTEVLIDEPTEAPTEAPTEQPTETPTEEPDEERLPMLVMRGRTLADRVNVRAEATTQSEVVAVVEPIGTVLEVTETVSVDGERWFGVLYEGVAGYIRGDLLEVWEEPEAQTSEDADAPLEDQALAEDASIVPFEQSQTVEGVTVTVSAEPGVFPEGATLSVTGVPKRAQREVDAAVEQERDEDLNVAVSYTFDIKLLDADGEALSFDDDQRVQVSFQLAEVVNENLETQVYHVTEDEAGQLSAEALEVVTEEETQTATVETDGFSYYTVEFTYGNLQYVMQGDSTIPLSEVLDYVGLSGDVTAVEVSNEALFSASNESGEWLVTAHQAFYTNEWMKVVIGGIDFEIEYLFAVTDAVTFPGQYAGGNSAVVQSGSANTFMVGSPEATIMIDKSKINNGKLTIPKGSSFSVLEYSSANGVVTGKVGYDGKLDMMADNHFTGKDDWFSYRYTGAATLPDGTEADMLITYSDVHIYTPIATYKNVDGTLASNFTYNGKTSLADGNRVFIANDVKSHIGVMMTATIQIVEKGTDNPVEGSFYYTMYDIDVQRNVANYMNLVDAGKNYNYSEQVIIQSGATSKAYVPNNYKSGITDGGGSDANGLRFLPTGYSDNDPGTFYTGFCVRADAAGFSLTVGGSGGSYFKSGGKTTWNTIQSQLFPDTIGALAVEKVVAGDYATESDRTREWTLTATVNGEHFQATAKDGETHVIGNFILGRSFSIVESAEDMDYYNTTYVVQGGQKENLSKTSEGGGRTAVGNISGYSLATFTNTRMTRKLTVKKNVKSSEHPEDLTKKWTFTLTATDGDEKIPITGLTVTSEIEDLEWTELLDDENKGTGQYTFKLSHDEALDITLPMGCHYSVTEETDRDFVQDASNAEGNLTANRTALFENDHRTEHDLTLEKHVSGNIGNRAKFFKFTVKLTLPENYGGEYTVTGLQSAAAVNARERTNDAVQISGSPTAESAPDSVNLTAGENNFTVWLADGDVFTIEGLPSGTEYVITEDNDYGYSVTTIVTGDVKDGGPRSGKGIELANKSTASTVSIKDDSLNKTTDISFINEKSVEVPTGIRTEYKSALWGGLMALLLAGMVCAGAKKRRRV